MPFLFHILLKLILTLMSMDLLTLSFYLLTKSLMIECSSAPSETVVISTKMGRVRGKVTRISNSSDAIITQFLGLPYALPPIREFRFQEPQKHPGWTPDGVLDCTVATRPHCTSCEPRLRGRHFRQEKNPEDEQGQHEENEENNEIIEDCLYLNIYFPGDLSSKGHIDTMELPVLVMLSNERDSKDFDAGESAGMFSHLTYYGDIIVVDLSFRSGILSYLAIANNKMSLENNGLKDQREAFLWIWDNIREFGGNPEQITVFAEYEASIHLGYHMLMPGSRGLFTRAVMHSGSVPLTGQFQQQWQNEEIAMTVRYELDCSNPVTAECLRAASQKKLVQLADAIAMKHGDWIHHHLVDHGLVSFRKASESGLFNRIDALIGFSDQDGLCYLEEMTAGSFERTEQMSQEFMDLVIRRAVRRFYGRGQEAERSLRTSLEAVLFEYFSCDGVRWNRTRLVAELFTDMIFQAPAELMARLMSRQENNIYLYSVAADNDRGCKSFRSMIRFKDSGHFDVLRPLNPQAKNAIDVLVNFVQKGNPNPIIGLNDWRSFAEYDRQFVQFNENGMNPKQDVRQRQMAFWNDYFPFLVDPESNSCQSDAAYPNLAAIGETGVTKQSSLILVCVVAVGAFLFLILMTLIIVWCNRRGRSSRFQNKGPRAKGPAGLDFTTLGPADDMHQLHPLPYYDESS